MSDTELAVWAAQQPLAYELVKGRLVLSAELLQSQSRLTAMRRIAQGVFGHSDQISSWLVAPSLELGGLSPMDLGSESEEGSQIVLRALIRRHRALLETRDG